MGSSKTNALLRHIRRIAAHHHEGHVPDPELLERFLTQKDDDAFTSLVRRHGPMVLAVCASIVNDCHLAEDAFQATFLLLAKKADQIRKRASLGSWLHGVARHVALKARASALKHRVLENKDERRVSCDPLLDMSLRELQAILHDELERLPEKYRAPVVLCYLEGMTHDQAGRQLGWTPGTVRGRVNRGRELLRGRLTRRGLAVPATLMTVALGTPNRSLAMSGGFVSQTVKTALATASGQACAGGLISAEVASLVKSGVHVLWLAKLKIVALMALTGGLISLAAWTVASAALAVNPGDITDGKESATPAVAKKGDQKQPVKDLYDDPLPRGALVRLGTVRLRHAEEIQSIAFSPDDRTIACAAGTNFISIWDRSTGKERGRIPGASGQTLAFSPDGRLLATAGGKHVGLWDLASGKRLHQLACQTFAENGDSTFALPVVPLVFSSDGRMVASANANHVAIVWDALAGRELARTAKQPNPIACLLFLPDGKTLVSLTGARQVDGAIQSWEVTTGRETSKVVVPREKTMTSQGLAIAPDGKTVAIEAFAEMREKQGDATRIYWAHCIRLLDATTGQQRLHIQGKNSPIGKVAFAPDGRSLAWSNMDNEVTVWDTETNRLVHRFRQTAGSAGGSYALAYDRQGKTLATATHATALQLWDLVAGRELLKQEAHGSAIRAVVYSPDGQTVASASDDQTIRVWDGKTGKPIATLTGHQGAADALACSPDGRYLATAAADCSVRLWDRATGRELQRFTLPNIDLGNGMSRGVTRSLAFTPNSQALIAAGSDLQFHQWNAETGKELHQLSWHLDNAEQPGKETRGFVRPARVRFSPDCRTAVAATEKAIHLVDVASGRQFAKLAGASHAEALAFSADSRVLVTGGWDKFLSVWEAASANKIREIKLPDYINSVAVSADGRIIAAGCGWNPASIHLFDVVSGQEVLAITGLASYIGDLAFAPDGQTLMSAHRDTTGLIWDVAAAYRRAKAAAKELDGDELQKLWTELDSEDAAKANAAAWSLRSAPHSAPAFLQGRLPPVPKVTVEKLQQLIVDLDANSFAKRQSASQELSKLGIDTHAELRTALEGKLSLELRRRIEALLAGPTRFVPNSAQLRRIRAIWVLEGIGGKESFALLRNLATGAPAAPETREANAALERMGGREP